MSRDRGAEFDYFNKDGDESKKDNQSLLGGSMDKGSP